MHLHNFLLKNSGDSGDSGDKSFNYMKPLQSSVSICGFELSPLFSDWRQISGISGPGCHVGTFGHCHGAGLGYPTVGQDGG
jgi:hypothetical protein